VILKSLMKGDVLSLATAVVIGAFGKIVTSAVNDVIMPIAVDWLHKNSLLLMGVLSILKQLKSRVQLNYHGLVQATINFVIVLHLLS
jgi:large conductance mechanosensitive channel